MADHGAIVIAVAVDVGGTFTDVVAVETATGHGHAIKVPTTPDRISEGVMTGTLAALERGGTSPASVERFVHGTTVGTNAVLERRGARVGLLTTEGFEDVLEIGRTKRRVLYDLNIETQTPVFLAPRRRRRGVRERLSANGTIVVELDESHAKAAIDNLIAQGVEAVAICLLHSYRNDVHERRLRELVLEREPGMRVSISSEVDPVFREYERTVVTCFDAYLRPVVASYLEDLATTLASHGIVCPLQLMQSRGGIASAERGAARPIGLLLSGPAAGAVGGSRAALRSRIGDVLTLDVGGTSADVALVEDGQPVVTTEGGIEGFPLRVPLVDLSTIGAGGGSIAWLDDAGGLRVGPRSAGAHPGPICYRRGGNEPTVTDAFCVLGYLASDGLAGGDLTLDLDAARAAFDRLGEALALGPEAAADGVVRVVTMRMVDQIRLASVGRGYDPRTFSLVALGGAGSLFAGGVARELGISRVVIPPVPGALSALGLLGAPVEHTMTETVAMRADATEPAALESIYGALENRVSELMALEGAPEGDVVTRRSADARYVGQGSTVEVPVAETIDAAELAAFGSVFHAQHDRVHGHSQPANPVELLNARVVQSWYPSQTEFESAVAPVSPGSERLAWFEGGARSTRVVDRVELDNEQSGPLIVRQPDTTILVAPGDAIGPDGSGNLIMRVS